MRREGGLELDCQFLGVASSGLFLEGGQFRTVVFLHSVIHPSYKHHQLLQHHQPEIQIPSQCDDQIVGN